MAIKLGSEKLEMQWDMKEEKKSLSDIDYIFKIWERDHVQHEKSGRNVK
jgi:hypothetical protein